MQDQLTQRVRLFVSELLNKLVEPHEGLDLLELIKSNQIVSDLSDKQLMDLVGSLMKRTKLSFTTYIVEKETL